MSLSMHGETLFHFTQSIDVLLEIVQSRCFKASLAMERLVYKAKTGETESTPDLWVPMVSFCDYKLSEIGHHALNYGYNGLGMSKSWGIRNKMNPVLYVSENSEVGSELRETLKDIADSINRQDMVLASIIRHANLFSWTKNYQGTL